MANKRKPRVQPDLLTAAGLLEWLRALPSKHTGIGTPYGHKSALEAACWYCAYRTVQGFFEETPRHLAQSLQAGDFKPFRTAQHIQTFLDGYDEDSVAYLEQDLNEFWEVSRG